MSEVRLTTKPRTRYPQKVESILLQVRKVRAYRKAAEQVLLPVKSGIVAAAT